MPATGRSSYGQPAPDMTPWLRPKLVFSADANTLPPRSEAAPPHPTRVMSCREIVLSVWVSGGAVTALTL